MEECLWEACSISLSLVLCKKWMEFNSAKLWL